MKIKPYQLAFIVAICIALLVLVIKFLINMKIIPIVDYMIRPVVTFFIFWGLYSYALKKRMQKMK